MCEKSFIHQNSSEGMTRGACLLSPDGKVIFIDWIIEYLSRPAPSLYINLIYHQTYSGTEVIVQNASDGLTAERAAVLSAVANGVNQFECLVIATTSHDDFPYPDGRFLL